MKWKLGIEDYAILYWNMPNIEPVFDFVFTDHALTEMARKNISREEVKAVLEKPEQRDMVREGRAVYQAKYDKGDPPKTYILRVFAETTVVESDEDKPGVILDYDDKGNLVSLEILDASQRVSIPSKIEYQVSHAAD